MAREPRQQPPTDAITLCHLPACHARCSTWLQVFLPINMQEEATMYFRDMSLRLIRCEMRAAHTEYRALDILPRLSASHFSRQSHSALRVSAHDFKPLRQSNNASPVTDICGSLHFRHFIRRVYISLILAAGYRAI